MATVKLVTSTELNETQLMAVHLVASGKRGKAIATELQVTEETVSRWQQLSAFVAAVNSLLVDAQEATRDRLRGLSVIALDKIEHVLNDENTPPRDVFAASFKVLELCNLKDLVSAKIGPCDVRDVERSKYMEELIR